MSLGKLPVLSWVSGSHGKRRLKSELTPDMISPPLGDFRHTMHVGRGGDVFGDTSFLSNHGGADTAKANNFFARTLRHVRRTPLRNRGGGGQAKASPAPPAISPIIKNAVSLPQLNEGTYDGGSGSRGLTSKFSFKSASNRLSKTHQVYAPRSWQPVWSSYKGKPPISPQPYSFPQSSLPEEAKRVMGQQTNATPRQQGLESGFCTIPRAPRLEKAQESTFPGEDDLNRSDSLLSFRLDLGPSLMSELLQVMSFSETNGNEVGEDGPDLPHGEGTKDKVLPASDASHREDKSTFSFWDRSGQTSLSGSSSLPGLSVHANGEAHAIEGAGEDPAWASGPGAVPRGTPWQGHWNDCTIEAGEFDRAAQVLARHYGGTSTPRSSEKSEGPRQARTQTLWESPSSSSWRSQVTGESLSPEATWNQGEEEEEEVEISSLQEGYVGARGMRNNSFEYADDEEDDEVKV